MAQLESPLASLEETQYLAVILFRSDNWKWYLGLSVHIPFYICTNDNRRMATPALWGKRGP